MLSKLRPILGVIVFGVAIQAEAVETGFTIGISAEATDNALLDSNERRDDVLETLELGANLQSDETWYNYRLDYQASHERYERDSFDTDTFYNGTAELNLIPYPGRFDWNFSVLSETTLQQSVAPNTPDNRDQRNIYSTTPKLVIISQYRDQVAVQANATKVDFRESAESDSDRVGVTGNWNHMLTELTRFDIRIGAQKVNFKDIEDYDSSNYQLGLTRLINGGEIDFSVGQTQITPTDSQKQDGMNYQVNANWTNEIHTISFEAFQDLTDSSVGLSGSFDFNNSITPSEINTDDVALITRTRFSLGDQYRFSSTLSFGANAYYDQEKAENGIRNTVRTGGIFNAAKTLSDSVRVRLDANYEHTDENVTHNLTIVRRYRISLDKNFGSQFLLSSWIGREESDSKQQGFQYEEHTLGMRFNMTI